MPDLQRAAEMAWPTAPRSEAFCSETQCRAISVSSTSALYSTVQVAMPARWRAA
jgi:hypothetical protein